MRQPVGQRREDALAGSANRSAAVTSIAGGPARADGLVHPVPVGAIALLIVNDHVLKASFPGWWTGKLSDVAGMVFFPLMLQALVELLDRREPFRPRRSALIACACATGLVFAATNTVPWAAHAYRVGLGILQWPFRLVASFLSGQGPVTWAPVRLTEDPTDLLAVPFVLVAVGVGWSRGSGPPAPHVQGPAAPGSREDPGDPGD